MMRNPFAAGRYDIAIERLTLDHISGATRVHAAAFTRAWSEEEFEALLVQDPVFGFAVRQVGRTKAPIAGFVLARNTAGEGEILTIAVSPAHRRMGLGRAMMDAVLRHLHSERAEALFLEVDETNLAAIGLYRRLGFREVGRREGYYSVPQGRRTSALVMRRDLR